MSALRLSQPEALSNAPESSTGSGPLTRHGYASDSCVLCGFALPPDSEGCFCAACAAGEPVFNDYIRTEPEARLAWAVYQLARNGLSRAIQPFPGDRPPRSALTGGRAGGNIFQRLREQVDLAQFAARYTELHPVAPGRWKGLCPIHVERTGSFYVYQDSQRWQCFGACASGGDVVELARRLMDLGKLGRLTGNP